MTREEGLDLPSMEEGREQTALLVENAMRKPVGLILKAGDTVADAVSRLADMTEDPLLVSYDTGRWTLVTKAALQDCAKAGKGGRTLATDFAGRTAVSAAPGPVAGSGAAFDARLRPFCRWCIAPTRGGWWACFRSTIYWPLTGALRSSRAAPRNNSKSSPQ